MAIAYYCYTGSVGLRFTVHAGNVAAIGSTFLLLVLLWFVVRKFLLSKKLDSSVLSYYRWGTLLAVFYFRSLFSSSECKARTELPFSCSLPNQDN